MHACALHQMKGTHTLYWLAGKTFLDLMCYVRHVAITRYMFAFRGTAGTIYWPKGTSLPFNPKSPTLLILQTSRTFPIWVWWITPLGWVLSSRLLLHASRCDLVLMISVCMKCMFITIIYDGWCRGSVDKYQYCIQTTPSVQILYQHAYRRVLKSHI